MLPVLPAFTSAYLTKPFSIYIKPIIKSNFCLCWDIPSSEMTTTSSNFIYTATLLCFMFLCSIKPSKYSLNHYDPKLSTTFQNNFSFGLNIFINHIWRLSISCIVFQPRFLSSNYSTMFLSNNLDLKHLACHIHKTQKRIIQNTVNLKLLPTPYIIIFTIHTFFKECFTMSTNLSRNHLHQGAPSKLNFQITNFSTQTTEFPDLYTFPLPETIAFGHPLLAVNFH